MDACAHMTGSCGAVWRRFNDTNADGASVAIDVVTESACLSYCASLLDCVAVDINWLTTPLQCWIHTSPTALRYRHRCCTLK